MIATPANMPEPATKFVKKPLASGVSYFADDASP